MHEAPAAPESFTAQVIGSKSSNFVLSEGPAPAEQLPLNEMNESANS